MNKRAALGVALLAALSLGAAACGGEAGSSEKSPGATVTTTTETPQTAQTRKPLAVLDTAVSRIEVFEDQPGEITVAEEVTIGTDPLIGGMPKQFTLAQLYEKVAPKLKKPLDAVVTTTLAEADERANLLRLQKAHNPPEAGEAGSTAVEPEIVESEVGPKTPNFFDYYDADVSWFHANYCNPGQPCFVWLTWAHSGRHTNITNWQCSVMNESDSASVTLTLWKKTCSGIFCSTNWTKTHVDNVAPRKVRIYRPTSSTEQGVECMGDGTDGSGSPVAMGLKWEAPLPPAPKPPAPSCGPYIYRAQTTGCTNGTDGSANGQRWCADGCGTTAQQAQDNATIGLLRQTPLNSGPGSCDYSLDQNFNYCGY